MKKLALLTTAAAVLLALAGPSLAAQREHRGFQAYASDRSGDYYYGPRSRQPYVDRRLTPEQRQYNATPYRGQYLPYPETPEYGEPNGW
jgi:hypothetical protein